jgi:hypothetical protein
VWTKIKFLWQLLMLTAILKFWLNNVINQTDVIYWQMDILNFPLYVFSSCTLHTGAWKCSTSRQSDSTTRK